MLTKIKYFSSSFMKYLLVALFLFSCSSPQSTKPVIGFMDQLQDETLGKAKSGFFDALKKEGFDNNNLEIIYRNAQNDQPTLIQSLDYIISKNPLFIATNPTLPTIAATQKTKTIPIFMMVSPRPDLAKLTDASGNAPANLFGVYETLDYLDTSIIIIQSVIPTLKRIGTIYNQSEPQSVDALNKIEARCKLLGLELIKLPVNSSNETQLVVQSLLSKKIDAFFALPDNTVFSSMEVIVKSCDDAKVPVFTSEEGLVLRGAVAAFGADMYQWGFQSGEQAAILLKTGSTKGIQLEPVKIRRRVFNSQKANQFGLHFSSDFVSVKN